MKNIYSTVFLSIIIVANTYSGKAQTIAATGSVKNMRGDYLHFVFVDDIQHKNAVYTDSLGNFSIKVYADSKLQFDIQGYKDTVINIGNNNSPIQLVLTQAVGGEQIEKNEVSTHSTISTQTITPYVSSDNVNAMTTGGTTPSLAHQKGSVHGNRYMFDNFVHGFAISPAGQIVYNPNYLFNYDKIGGVLLFSPDNKTIAEINSADIKTLILYNSNDERIVMEKIAAVDNAHYLQVLSSGKNYSIYKSVSTRFVKSDYVNSGITSHGNDYDEFIDDYTYYVLDVQNNQLQKIALKKKAIKAVFVKEGDKVNKFINNNSGDIDDAYLNKLGDYMNN